MMDIAADLLFSDQGVPEYTAGRAGSILDNLGVIVRAVPPEYEKVAASLAQPLHNLPGYVVAIDGKDGAGKTSLGRFLAWHFNVALIETDLFLVDGDGPLAYYDEHIKRIVEHRLGIPRPVIAEGVRILDRLSQIGINHDFLIYLRLRDYSSSERMKAILAEYEARVRPESRANIVVEVSH